VHSLKLPPFSPPASDQSTASRPPADRAGFHSLLRSLCGVVKLIFLTTTLPVADTTVPRRSLTTHGIAPVVRYGIHAPVSPQQCDDINKNSSTRPRVDEGTTDLICTPLHTDDQAAQPPGTCSTTAHDQSIPVRVRPAQRVSPRTFSCRVDLGHPRTTNTAILAMLDWAIWKAVSPTRAGF